MKAIIAAGCCLFFSLSITLMAQPFGIDTRVENTELLINDLPADVPGTMVVERVFPQLDFEAPVYITESPDGSNRIFVVERPGRILTFPNIDDPTPAQVSTFLDIRSLVRSGGESGLLGLAFDPDYGSNGEFYVYYTWIGTNPGTSRVSRFTNDVPGDDSVSSATEEILFQLQQPFSNHNAGMIEFGPDNMLYIALGDGGDGGDPFGHGQNTETFFGNILRIDVRGEPDPGLEYRIPPDNPFFDGGPAGNDTKKEIYAYGLRNPWRFSFDMVNGTLFCGDVGQGSREEIDVIESGDNLGWDIMEGFDCFQSDDCDQSGLTLPIVDYPRSQGQAVTGGYVYYGSKVPELYGLYIYGDYASGRIWGLRYDDGDVEGPFVLVSSSGLGISSFGQDESGEVFVVDLGGGIYELQPETPGGGDFPTRLSDIPALLDAGKGIDQTDKGIIPFAPSAQLWSDGALKERFIALPNLEQIDYTSSGGWNFPENSIVIKNFLMPLDERDPQATAQRIETRLLYRKNDQWHGFAYEWNEDETDAVLLTGAKTREFNIINKQGQAEQFNYLIPSSAQCQNCHTNAANGVLGLTTPAMNSDFDYPASGVADNQLRTFDHIALFTDPLPGVPANLPRMPDPFDPAQPLRERARAYLAANCSHCHRPFGTAPTELDLRWEASDAQMNAIDLRPLNGNVGIDDAFIILSGSPERSVLLERMERRDGLFQMPPLATSRQDREAIELIRKYILSLGIVTGVENSDLYY